VITIITTYSLWILLHHSWCHVIFSYDKTAPTTIKQTALWAERPSKREIHIGLESYGLVSVFRSVWVISVYVQTTLRLGEIQLQTQTPQKRKLEQVLCVLLWKLLITTRCEKFVYVCLSTLFILKLKWCQLNTFFLLWRCDPTRARVSWFLRFLDHTKRRITVGRNLLDEWSARRRDLYLTTHKIHNRQISMPPVGFFLILYCI
jgi:hypothetical protein